MGRQFSVTFKQRLGGTRSRILQRTVDTWGDECQSHLAGLHFGIIGVGSVGCVIAEALARMGIERITVIDPDHVEAHNLDRLLYASEKDIGSLKVNLVAKHVRRSATASRFEIYTYALPIQAKRAFAAALDCDILFSAVDRPLPKDIVNHVAYAHFIPVISGGVFIDSKPDGSLGQASWAVTTIGPDFRCLRCDGQYTSSDVILDVDGSLDNPTYIHNLANTGQAPRNQNVFAFGANLATSMVIVMIRLVISDTWWPVRSGRQHYSLIPNRLEVEDLKCNEHCSIIANTALGDQFRYPFLQIEPAEVRDKASVLSRFLGRCRKHLVRLQRFLRNS